MFLKYLFSLLSTCSSMPSHVDVSYDDLFGALQCYSTCEQRLGKWGSVRREQNRRNWMSERGWRGSVPLSSCLQYKHWSLSAGNPLLLFSPRIISALPRQSLPGVSLCVCVWLYLCVCVCVSLWVTTCRKGRKRCPASKPITRGAWLAMWCKCTLFFFFFFFTFLYLWTLWNSGSS